MTWQLTDEQLDIQAKARALAEEAIALLRSLDPPGVGLAKERPELPVDL